MWGIWRVNEGPEKMKKSFGPGGNVTPLLHYQKPMKNAVLVELLDHWERLRAGRIAPLRSEIDPRAIENVLEHAFILERTNNNEPRFRIAGMQLCELMGMEIRGMPATAMIAPDCRAQFTALVRDLFEKPEIIELRLEVPRPGRASLTADMLLLPMKSDLGEVSRVLGCLVDEGVRATPPHRFQIKSHKSTRIIATGYRAEAPAMAGFAEEPDVFVPPGRVPTSDARAAKPRSYLRLVKSDE